MKLLKTLKILPYLLFLLIPDIVYGQGTGIGLSVKNQPGGLSIVDKENDPGGLLSNLLRNSITLFFSIGGIGFTIMILWGGVNWILSGGDKEKIASARKRITTAIIGLVLLSLTFVIMVVIGQITGISALQSGVFSIPGLLDETKK